MFLVVQPSSQSRLTAFPSQTPIWNPQKQTRDVEIILKRRCQSDLLPRRSLLHPGGGKEVLVRFFVLSWDSTLLWIGEQKKKIPLPLLRALVSAHSWILWVDSSRLGIIKHLYAGSALVSSAKGLFSNSGLCSPEQLVQHASERIIKYNNTSRKNSA